MKRSDFTERALWYTGPGTEVQDQCEDRSERPRLFFDKVKTVDILLADFCVFLRTDCIMIAEWRVESQQITLLLMAQKKARENGLI